MDRLYCLMIIIGGENKKESKDSLFLYCYDNICFLLDLIIFRDATFTLYTLEELSSWFVLSQNEDNISLNSASS